MRFLMLKRPERQTAGALELDALIALQTVALEGLVPESIQLIEGCELHITQHDQSCIEDAVWDTVLPHLRSVWLSDGSAVYSGAAQLLAQGGQPYKGIIAGPAVWHCGCASAARRHACASGRSCRAVQGSACHRARSCCLARRQPGSKQPPGLEVQGCCELWERNSKAVPSLRHVTGMLPMSLAGRYCSCSIACLTRHAHLQGTTLSELSAILARRAPEWNGHFCESGGISGMCFPWAVPPWTMEVGLYKCCCNACWRCLGAGGILH